MPKIDSQGQSAIMIAAKLERFDMLNKILELNASIDVNMKGNNKINIARIVS